MLFLGSISTANLLLIIEICQLHTEKMNYKNKSDVMKSETNLIIYIMNDSKRHVRPNLWLIIGVVILIVLLLLWLTFADLTGDTDVAATILPMVSNLKIF